MSAPVLILFGALLATVLLLTGIKIGQSTAVPPVPKPPKAPKKPKGEPMPLHGDPWDNALQGDPEPRISTVED